MARAHLEDYDEEEPDREQEPDVWEVWDNDRAEHLDGQVDEALSVAGSLEF